MITFGFTQKKFTSLTPGGRHRHAAAWLTNIFQTLRTGRVSTREWQQFTAAYGTILEWMGHDPPPALPDDGGTPSRLAWISDAIQFHRDGAGMTVRDPDLAATMITGDRITPQPPPPGMTYQVALDGLRSLFNIGAIYRTCEAAGVRTILLGNCPGKEDPRVRKTAMGAHERIREEATSDLAAALMEKKAAGFTVLGIDTLEGSVPCHQFDWPARAVLVFGNEEYGIAPHILPVMDHFVHIPMFGAKNSLNVGAAVSAVLFQAVLSFTSSGQC